MGSSKNNDQTATAHCHLIRHKGYLGTLGWAYLSGNKTRMTYLKDYMSDIV